MLKGNCATGSTRAVDRVDQHLAVVDVDGHPQRRAERRRKRDVVVGVVERGDVFDQGFLKVEIVGMVDALQPRRQPEQIEAMGVAFPLVGGVVLGVLPGELREIGDPLFSGERILGVDRCGGHRQQQQREGEATHGGLHPASCSLRHLR